MEATVSGLGYFWIGFRMKGLGFRALRCRA